MLVALQALQFWWNCSLTLICTTQLTEVVPCMMMEDKQRQGQYLLCCCQCHATLLCFPCCSPCCQVQQIVIAVLKFLVLLQEPAKRVHQLQPIKTTERSENGVDDRWVGGG